MKSKDRLLKKLQIAVCDKRELDRQILHLHKCFKEAAKCLNRSKK